jgi:pilus assembly protein Flp/PilA
MNSIKNFINDESGVTAIEYALIAALIAVVIIAAVRTLGTKIAAIFTSVKGSLDGAVTTP